MTSRLDLDDSFLKLSTDVLALRNLSFIAEEFSNRCFQQTELDCNIKPLQSSGYTVTVMTEDQSRAFDFLIVHIGDTARRAATTLEALEGLASEYVRTAE